MAGIAGSYEKFSAMKGKGKKPMPMKRGKKPMPPMKGKSGSAKKMPMPMGEALGSYMHD